MHIKFWITIGPLNFRRTDDELKREGVVKAFLLREVQVGGVDAMVDSNEHLTLTGIHYCIVLCVCVCVCVCVCMHPCNYYMRACVYGAMHAYVCVCVCVHYITPPTLS